MERSYQNPPRGRGRHGPDVTTNYTQSGGSCGVHGSVSGNRDGHYSVSKERHNLGIRNLRCSLLLFCSEIAYIYIYICINTVTGSCNNFIVKRS